MIVEPGKTYVRRLKALSAERDALALRLRLERALSSADLHPPGLPRSAVLCVRRLSGRRAHALLAAGAGRYALADWQRAVAAAVEQLARRAASPARGPVPANAEAVVFRDQAELLACLAADCCDEAAPARWWWRSLFGGRDAAAAMLSAWLDAPEHVPAALGRLAASGRLVAFARRLGEGEARALRRAVVQKFGLRELHAALEAPAAREEAPAARGDAAAGETAEGRVDVSSHAPSAPAPAPWEREAPELRGYGLGREQACAAGVGLMLLRAPARARSSSFARLVTDWLTAAPSPPAPAPTRQTEAPAAPVTPREVGVADAPPPRDIRPEARASSEAAVFDGRVPEGEAGLGDAPPEAAPRGVVTEARGGAEPAPRDAGSDALSVESAANGGGGQPPAERGGAAPRSAEAPRVGEVAAVSEPRGAGEVRAGGAAAVSDEPFEVVAPAVVYEARIQTGFGGLFYLINVGLRLNLYGDFTTPLSPGLSLSVWDFLALLGRRLCGGRVEEDAVWALLARLAGRREGEGPGHDFAPDEEWRVPPAWLAPFAGGGAWEWAAAGGRLRVRHPAGFLVLDVPLGARRTRREVGRRLAQELEAYGGRSDVTLRPAESEDFEGAREFADEGAALGRWLGRLAPYVSARLRVALGTDEAARLLCEQRARVSVSETRLDVTFALERLPLEVRLAGLDRDPGWVPAAGRRVAFHYE